ncbi:MAG: DUF2336 domain-containing protein [Xanthobacteraceae bacterium]|nr:MAG: DUF2336 domain-containing protein [Xanthobacteraceae bacterium]
MTHTPAITPENLIEQLEDALAQGHVAHRVNVLRRITDLFVARAPDYTDEQIAVFDDVFAVLVSRIETDALVLLSHRLAPVRNAPPKAIRTLAFDDRSEVAAPVLAESARLDDATLIENAKTKGQGHLLAISKRSMLSPQLTDILIERGNRVVAHSVAGNPGASFSEAGYTRLIDRCDGDDELAGMMGAREGIPRHHFLRLLAKASHAARARLEALHPDLSREIADAVADATDAIQRDSAERSQACIAARNLVAAMHKRGELNEAAVRQFIAARKFEEITASLATLAGLSPELAESMMVESRSEGVLVIARSCGFSWPTVEAILRMRGVLSGLTSQDLELCKASFVRLKLTTAQQVLRFHRMREKSRAAAELGYVTT